MGYTENPDHTPDPTAFSGTLDTSGTAGHSREDVGTVSGLFGAKAAVKVEEIAEVPVEEPTLVEEPTSAESSVEAADEVVVADEAEEVVVAPPVELFDPEVHGAPEVKAYLKTADAAERKRVLSAEKKGKGRKTILG